MALTKAEAYDQMAAVVHEFEAQEPPGGELPEVVTVPDGESLQEALDTLPDRTLFMVEGRRSERVRVRRPGVVIAFDGPEAGIDGVDNEPALGVYANNVHTIGGLLRPGGSADRCTLAEVGEFDATDPAAQPTGVKLDDLVLEGGWLTKHALAIHGGVHVLRLTIVEVGLEGVETHGVWVLNTPGNVLVEDSHIEAAGIGFFIGGDSFRIGQVPDGVTLRNTLLLKPDAWRPLGYTVKNGYEAKAGKNLLVEYCTLDGCWADGQDGKVVNVKAEDQYGQNPFVSVEHFVFRRNTIRRCAGGIGLGGPENYPNAGMRDVVIAENVCEIDKNIMGDRNTAGSGRALQIVGPVDDLAVQSNTFNCNGSSWAYTTAGQSQGAQFMDNVANHGSYGFTGDNVSPKSSAVDCLARYYPGALWEGNTVYVQAGKTHTYPPGTTILSQSRGARTRWRQLYPWVA